MLNIFRDNLNEMWSLSCQNKKSIYVVGRISQKSGEIKPI